MSQLDKIPQTVRDTILKIKALADEGVAGERESAKQMLQVWMAKYNLSEEDLLEEERFIYKFSYPRNPWERRIFIQCLAKVLNVGSIEYGLNRTQSIASVKLTKVEKADFEELYDWYLKAFRKRVKENMDVFTSAFISRNDIYPDVGDDGPRKPLTRAELKRAFAVSALAAAMEPDTHFKQLEK